MPEVQAINELSRLQRLFLHHNNLQDSGIQALKGDNPTSLTVHNNHVGDIGAKALGYHTQLTALDVHGNHISEVGVVQGLGH